MLKKDGKWHVRGNLKKQQDIQEGKYLGRSDSTKTDQLTPRSNSQHGKS